MIILAGFIVLIIVALGLLFAVVSSDLPHFEKTAGAERASKLQTQVGKKYKKLKTTGRKRSFSSICFPKSFEVQSPQKFVGKWLSPSNSNKEMLAFHGIGSGKTCVAVQAILPWLSRGKPLVVTPAALVPGFRTELSGLCAGNAFASDDDRAILANPTHPKYTQTRERIANSISDSVDIMSYNSFLTMTREGKRGQVNPPILIVDEAHNLCNPTGNYNRATMDFIKARPEMRVLLMTATPIYDNPKEFIALLRLLRREIPDKDAEEILSDPRLLKDVTNGLVSYYAGPPPYTYPEMTIKYEVCTMSKHQTKWYKSQVEKEMKDNGVLSIHSISNSFYAASRAKAICVFRDGISGTAGLSHMRKKDLMADGPLSEYSCKIQRLVEKLKSGKLSFVYSNFAGPNGIQFLVKALEANGWREYRTPGPGRAYAIFSGEESSREKDDVRAVFNAPENDRGKNIQVVIGSPAIKEGVSFFRMRHVHILDPYWNYSRIEQIYGRASRYCSHKSLPEEKRKVTVFLYIAQTAGNEKMTARRLIRSQNPKISVDAFILSIAESKLKLNRGVLKTIIGNAVDRELGYGDKS